MSSDERKQSPSSSHEPAGPGEERQIELFSPLDEHGSKLTEEQIRIQAVALEAARNGILVSDLQGRITWVNPAFCEMTGYSLDEVKGQHTRLLKSGKHDERLYRGLWQTINAGEVWSGEMVNRRSDGSLYTEDMTISPVRDAEGEVSHFVAIKQDITHRKNADKTVRHLMRETEILRQIASTTATVSDPDLLLNHVAEVILDTISIDLLAIALLDSNKKLRVLHWQADGLRHETRVSSTEFDYLARAMRERKAVRIDDSNEELELMVRPPRTLGDGHRSVLAVPLLAGNALLGALNLEMAHPAAFLVNDEELMAIVAGQLASALQSLSLSGKVRRLAALDHHTGAFNRRRFMEIVGNEIERARRSARTFSLLMFDVDLFKKVNDHFGHSTGDSLLEEIAKCCRQQLRTIDAFARLGGEEFSVLLPETGVAEAELVAQRLRAAIEKISLETAFGPATVTISVGVVDFDPDCREASTMLTRADHALALAKQSGRNCVKRWQDKK
jgi:diguanylate cyclase (GGDEF)-like protein/PAS domain S-box-containing protein